MTLEGLAKYFSPKSIMIGNNGGPATASDSLSISDVMAVIGLADSRAEFGIELYLAKVGVSSCDRAIELLSEFANKSVRHYKNLRHIPDRDAVVRELAIVAFKDYSRSASSKEDCRKCNGTGFIEERKFVMNKMASNRADNPAMLKPLPASIPHYRDVAEGHELYAKLEYYDFTKKCCPHCKGKKQISMACKDCRGRKTAIDLKESKKQGVPVMGDCKRCKGRGYSRQSAEVARVAIERVTDRKVAETTWRRVYKQFYEKLIQECEIQESYAGQVLRNAAR